MKLNKLNISAILLSSTMLLTSCEAVQNSNSQQRGTAIGAGAGAILGGILGNNLGKGGNSALGAVLGAVVGGTAGNLIGRKMDRQAKQIKEVLPGAEVERVGEGIKITMKESLVNFASNSSELTSNAKNSLSKLITALVNSPVTNISVYWHTDAVGRDDYNLKLSQKRAEEVKAYLVSNGISPDRITAIGMGETSPVSDNSTDSGRAENRRVEFAITANENMIKEAQSGK